MRKLSVLLSTLFLFAMAGCSEDPTDVLISRTLKALGDTTGDIDDVTKELTNAIAQAKNDKTPLAIGPIESAVTKADKLKARARELQQIKAHTDSLKDTSTPQMRADYAQQYKQRFQNSLEALDTAQKKLDAALREADAVADDTGKSALEKLRQDKLKEGQNEFEVLNKRQS